MAKLLIKEEANKRELLFFCPGCRNYHMFDERWQWNGDMDKPTFSPSLLCGHTSNRRCHSFVRDGRIEFLSDCDHELAGQTVDMLEEPEQAPAP